MDNLFKFIALVLIAAGGLASIIMYWLLRNLETDFVATANSTAGATNYFGYVDTINYFPHAAWLILLVCLGVGVFLLLRH